MLTFFGRTLSKEIREMAEAQGISANDLLKSAIDLYKNISECTQSAGGDASLVIKVAKDASGSPSRSIKIPTAMLSKSRVRDGSNVVRICDGTQKREAETRD